MDGQAGDRRVERVVAEYLLHQRGELIESPRHQVAAGGRCCFHGGAARRDPVALTLASPPDEAVSVVGIGPREALLRVLELWGERCAPLDRSSHPPPRLRLGKARCSFTAVAGYWLLGVAQPGDHTALLARDEEQLLVLVGEGERFELVLEAGVEELPREIDLGRLIARRSRSKQPRSPAAATPREAPAKIASAIHREHSRILEGPTLRDDDASTIARVLEAAFDDAADLAERVEMPEAAQGKKRPPRRGVTRVREIFGAILQFALEFGIDVRGSGRTILAALIQCCPSLTISMTEFNRTLNLIRRAAPWLVEHEGQRTRRLATGKILDPNSDEHRRMCAATSTGAGRRPPRQRPAAQGAARHRPAGAATAAVEVGEVVAAQAPDPTPAAEIDVVAASAPATPSPCVGPVDRLPGVTTSDKTPAIETPSPRIESIDPPVEAAAVVDAEPAAATPNPGVKQAEQLPVAAPSFGPAIVREAADVEAALLALLGEECMRAVQPLLRSLDPGDQSVALSIGVELAERKIAGDRGAAAIILYWGSPPSSALPGHEGDSGEAAPEAEDRAPIAEDPTHDPQPAPEEHARGDDNESPVLDLNVAQSECEHPAHAHPIEPAPDGDPCMDAAQASTPLDGNGDDRVDSDLAAAALADADSVIDGGDEAPLGVHPDVDLIYRLLEVAPGPAYTEGPLRELDSLLDAGKLDEAQGLLDRLAQDLGRWRRPHRAQLHLRAASLAHAQSRGREALEHLERAAAILPRDAQILQLLAAACDELGEHQRAVAAYAALILEWKRSPGSADADAIAKIRHKLDQAAAVRTQHTEANENHANEPPQPSALPMDDETPPHADHTRSPSRAVGDEPWRTRPSPTLSSITAALMLTLGPRPPPTRVDLPPVATPSRGKGSADDIREISPAPLQPRSSKTLTGTLGPRGPPIAPAEIQPPITASPVT